MLNRYRPNSTEGRSAKGQPASDAGSSAAMTRAYTGRRAEHEVSGITIMVSSRSRNRGMVRVAMTAGTAQKVTLNLLSTLIMIRLGRVYRGMMVDVIASSDKLRDRAARIVMEAAGVGEDAARQALAASENAVKPAVLIARGMTLADAQALLDAHGGDLRLALADVPVNSD